MADGNGNVYVGQKEIMSSYNSAYYLKSISSFHEDKIEIHDLNGVSRYLLKENRWNELAHAEKDDKFRKTIVTELNHKARKKSNRKKGGNT